MDLVLQRAVNALSLEDNEAPLILSAKPEYRAPEHHNRSILGRLLNPKVQKVSDIIHALPRKWGVFDSVRGIALSSDKFQFIFKYEEDLKRVLEIGVWTHEDWSVVLQRWTEFPPEDYLDIMPVWIRMRNVPYNFYAKRTFDDLAEIVGKVDIMAYDEEKLQSRDYVRVRVFFNVNNPVRKFQGLQLPNGENIKVGYEFERIRRRCYACQRLTHDRDHCPFLQALLNVESSTAAAPSIVLLPSDPLYEILSEEQVGLDHISGRPKIAESVLEEMIQYMIIENGLNKSVKAARIKASLKELSLNKTKEKQILALEPPPQVTSELYKGKGIVFHFTDDTQPNQVLTPEEITKDPIKIVYPSLRSVSVSSVFARLRSNPTVYKSVCLTNSVAGDTSTKSKKCQRPNMHKRKHLAAKGVTFKTETRSKSRVSRKRKEEVVYDSLSEHCGLVSSEGAPHSI